MIGLNKGQDTQNLDPENVEHRRRRGRITFPSLKSNLGMPQLHLGALRLMNFHGQLPIKTLKTPRGKNPSLPPNDPHGSPGRQVACGAQPRNSSGGGCRGMADTGRALHTAGKTPYSGISQCPAQWRLRPLECDAGGCRGVWWMPQATWALWVRAVGASYGWDGGGHGWGRPKRRATTPPHEMGPPSPNHEKNL